MARSNLETTSLHEDHHIGRDGIPTHHVTHQYVRATADGVEHFPHYFDTGLVRATLQLGGTPSPVMKHDENTSVVHYRFDHPLPLGKIHHFRYRLDFLYEEAPAPYYRRKIHGQYRNGWNVHIFFHPERLPRKSGGRNG
jgi:hypothetical protein